MSAVDVKRREAEAARARLSETFAAIRHKTSPKVIAQEAIDSAKETGSHIVETVREKGSELAETSVTVVKENPQATAAAVVATAAILFRKPLGRLVSSFFKRDTQPEPKATVPLAVVPMPEELTS